MSKTYNKSDRRPKKITIMILSAVLLLTLITACVSSLFVEHIRSKVRSTTVQVISELTTSKVKILNGLINEAAVDTRILAENLGIAPDLSHQLYLLEAFKNNHNTEMAALVNDDGQYLYGSESELALNGLPSSFANEVSQRGYAISDSVVNINGTRHILFGSLISGGGRVYTALSIEKLQDTCGKSTYRDEGYSYVVEFDGNIIVPPLRYSYEQIYSNISALISDNDNDTGELNKFMNALAEGKAGSIIFTFENERQLLCFEPLGTEKNWQFITVVPLSAAEQDGSHIINTSIIMAVIIVTVFAITFITYILLYALMQHKARENDRFMSSICQAISENTDTVIFILDNKTSQLDFVFENSGRLLGIPSQEFMENEPTAGGAFKDTILSLLREQRPLNGYEQIIHAYNDRLQKDMWLKVLICPFILSNRMKYIFAVNDVTAENNAREKITSAVIAAEQANSAKSNFLANMSHDMRTPMNGIVGMVAIARKNIDDRERLLDCLDKVDLSSKHLLGLINDVLDMSRIESGKLVLTNEPFCIESLILGLKPMLISQCDAKKLTLAVNLNIKNSALVGDTIRLTQIFMNLLSNAVKFTPEGGTVRVTATELAQRHTGFVPIRFIVEDNGIGMTPEFLNVLFTPFERAKDMSVRQAEGTGLGMPITKNLVSAMGGHISVESELRRGSTFTVELELQMQDYVQIEQTAEEAAPDETFDFTGKRLLLAEDNDLNREIAIDILSETGAMVEAVANGKLALDKFAGSANGYYDAVLLDIQMPVMDGHAAARAIRKSGHPQAESIPVIAMTANAFAEDIKSAIDSGMNAHISKPINITLLHKTLAEYLKTAAK